MKFFAGDDLLETYEIQNPDGTPMDLSDATVSGRIYRDGCLLETRVNDEVVPTVIAEKGEDGTFMLSVDREITKHWYRGKGYELRALILDAADLLQTWDVITFEVA